MMHTYMSINTRKAWGACLIIMGIFLLFIHTAAFVQTLEIEQSFVTLMIQGTILLPLLPIVLGWILITWEERHPKEETSK